MPSRWCVCVEGSQPLALAFLVCRRVVVSAHFLSPPCFLTQPPRPPIPSHSRPQLEELNEMKDKNVFSGLERLSSPSLPISEARTISVRLSWLVVVGEQCWAVGVLR